MGRHLQHKNTSVKFKANNPSCMWGILDFLDYHRWYSIKRILPHRKHNRGRHARCWGNPKTVSFGHGHLSETWGLLDTEADSHPAIHQDRKTNQCCAKGISKTLIHEEISKEDTNEYCSSDSSAESRERQTSLDHYEEHSDSVLTKRRNNRTKSVKFHDSLSVGLQNSYPSKHDKLLARNNVDAKVMQPADTLEVFKVKQELFLKVFQDLDYQDRQSISPKPKLTKSGSFPTPRLKRSRPSKPSTLEHKQSEAWSFCKGRNSLSSVQDSMFSELKFQKNSLRNSVPLKDKDVKEPEPRASSQSLSKGLVNQGWNQMVINRFKHIKKRIKHVLMENKKERNHTASDALLSGSSSLSSEKETTACKVTQDNHEFVESNTTDYKTMKSTEASLKRISSLNESLDKYIRLIQQGSKKTDTLQQSRSLKLTSEDGVSANRQARKSFRRNLSVPDIDLVCLSLFEVPHDVLIPSPAAKIVVNNPIYNDHGTLNVATPVIINVNTQNNEPLASLENPDFEEKIQCSASEEVDDNCEDNSNAVDLNKEIVEVQIEKSKQESIIYNERVPELTVNVSRDLAQKSSGSASGTSFPGDQISQGDFVVMEAPKARTQSDQPAPLMDAQKMSAANSILCIAEDPEKVKNVTKDIWSDLELDKDISDFSYVKNILALSGFYAKEYQGFWDSEDQPLSPSLFKELENSELSSEDVHVYYRRQIIFELVNEVIADMYDRTFTYFPRPFSLSSCVHPWPMGHHLLDEVWKRVSWYMSLRPELDMTLDDVVGRDLSRDDGWMNIKLENECLTLQLETLIFDELLQEVICS